MIAASRLAPLVTALALLAGTVAETSAEGDPYSLDRLRAPRGFAGRGVIRSIAAGGERIDGLSQVELDSQGRIVVAGHSMSRDDPDAFDPDLVPAVARFRSDGRLDASFGGNGIVVLPLTGRVAGLAIDSQDRVAISGPFDDSTIPTESIVVVRLLEDGTPDAAFGQAGFARFSRATASDLSRLRVDPRDDALVGIDFNSASITRLTSAGALDPLFGTGGSAPIPPESLGLAIDAQGRCVVSSEQATVRVLSDGTQDPAFGTAGLLRGPLGGAMGSHAVAIDGQQRIVMRGYEDGVSRGVYRFLPTGEPDATFGEGGVAAVPIAAPGNAEAPELAIGVSRGATARYAFSSTLHVFARNLSRQVGFGSLVQVVDPENPQALAARVSRDPRIPRRRVQTFLDDVAVSDDGARAYAVGGTVVQAGSGRWLSETPVLLCLDLDRRIRASLPDFTVAWVVQPVAQRSEDEVQLLGTARVTNAGRGAAANVRISYLLSDDTIPSSDDDVLFGDVVGPLAPGASRVFQLPATRFSGSWPKTSGRFLIAVANLDGIVPETDTGNDAAASWDSLD